MASSLPIPAPPRTPTPPTPIPEEEQQQGGLGIGGVDRTARSTITFDPNSLSPLTDTFPGRFGSMNSSMNSPASVISPASSDGSMAPPPAPGNGAKSPFNFQTQTIKDTPVVAKSVGPSLHSSSHFLQQIQNLPEVQPLCKLSLHPANTRICAESKDLRILFYIISFYPANTRICKKSNYLRRCS
jgi:hypothetical protein